MNDEAAKGGKRGLWQKAKDSSGLVLFLAIFGSIGTPVTIIGWLGITPQMLQRSFEESHTDHRPFADLGKDARKKARVEDKAWFRKEKGRGGWGENGTDFINQWKKLLNEFGRISAHETGSAPDGTQPDTLSTHGR